MANVPKARKLGAMQALMATLTPQMGHTSIGPHTDITEKYIQRTLELYALSQASHRAVFDAALRHIELFGKVGITMMDIYLALEIPCDSYLPTALLNEDVTLMMPLHIKHCTNCSIWDAGNACVRCGKRMMTPRQDLLFKMTEAD